MPYGDNSTPLFPDWKSGTSGGGVLDGVTGADWLSAGSSVLGSAFSSKPAGPSSANSIFGTNLAFDNSGFSIAFPGANLWAPTDKTTTQGGATGAAGSADVYFKYALIFAGALVAWKLATK